MPHPYHGEEQPVFGPYAILQRPELASYIGAIATTDEAIQESWGIILALALAADARVGTELYLSLTGSNAQAAVLNKAIEIATEGEAEIQEAYKQLLKDQKGRSGERNRIVHGRWGILPSRQDVLILGERNWLPKAIAALNHYYEREWVEGEEFYLPEPAFDRQSYRLSDLKDALVRLIALHDAQHAFMNQLRALQTKRREKRRQQEDWTKRGILTAPMPEPLGQPETNPEGSE